MTTATPGTGVLGIDGERFAERFSTRPLGVRHTLADHPLLTLDALAELADALPTASIEQRRADGPALAPGEGAAVIDRRPSDTVRELDSGKAWMVLWYIEQVPEYRELLDQCLDQVESHVGDRNGGMRQRRGFVFLSAPDAVTPAHVDPEQNLLLQIRGRKTMNVGRYADDARREAEIERYFLSGHRNMDELPELDEAFVMDPGDGVYVYPFAPHWVQNGPTPSVSLSITFRTPLDQRAERIQNLNKRLRRLHLDPAPPGRSALRDNVKSGVVLGLSRFRRSDPTHRD